MRVPPHRFAPLRATARAFPLVAVCASVAAAQGAVRYTVGRADGGLTFVRGVDGDTDRGQAIAIAPGGALAVRVACQDGVDCRTLVARVVGGQDVGTELRPAAGASATEATWALTMAQLSEPSGSPRALRLGTARSALPDLRLAMPSPVKPDTASRSGTGTETSFTPRTPLGELLGRSCEPLIRREIAALSGREYDAGRNLAYFVVTPTGMVRARPGPIVDTDDRVLVRVVGERALVQQLLVRRSSAFGAAGIFRAVGEDVSIPAGVLKAARDSAPTEPDCTTYDAILQDFQAGRAEVTLSVTNDKAAETVVGKFEFGVNPLYSGAFALGAIRTSLRNPSYGFVPGPNGDSLITVTEGTRPRVLYTLTYTPFVWGKRDLEKPEPTLSLRRLNPMFGLVLDDWRNNFVLGATYDLATSVYLTGGYHLGRVRRLDTRDGVREGAPFVGTRAQIPTVTDWDGRGFVGLSLDLRAAAVFLGKVVGAAAKPAG